MVEVLASLVLMGGALVSLLLTQAHSITRVQDVQMNLEAQRLSRELIAEWRLKKVDLRSPGHGTWEHGWRWKRTHRQVDLANHPVTSEITIRVEHLANRQDGNVWSREFVWLIRHENP